MTLPSQAPSLHGRRFRAVSDSARPPAAGDVDSRTLFEYREHNGLISAEYRGGEVRAGHLVGTREGDELEFRYVHLDRKSHTASGHCRSRVGVDADGRLRLDETWRWESRAGDGTSTLRECGLGGSVLFVCTGNFYRSRFAEHFFEHLAAERGLDWRADSRGLRGWDTGLRGRMSAHSVAALEALGVEMPLTLRPPQLATPTDLEAATRIIALDDQEHPPYVEQWLPKFRHRFEYWSVPDVDRAEPSEALPAIEAQVRALVDALLAAARPVPAK
jgi:protein-tyrosine-phosphatase